jgi:hypothetical protein
MLDHLGEQPFPRRDKELKLLERGMKRRAINLALGLAAAAWPPLARGQQSSKPLRVGLVGVETFNSENAFIQRLGELGFVQGRNLSIDREVNFPEFLGVRECPEERASRCGRSGARSMRGHGLRSLEIRLRG